MQVAKVKPSYRCDAMVYVYPGCRFERCGSVGRIAFLADRKQYCPYHAWTERKIAIESHYPPFDEQQRAELFV